MKKFATAAKVATATMTDAAGSQTLEVRKDKDNNYYAKSSAVEGMWKTLPNSAMPGQGPGRFPQQEALRFRFQRPDEGRIEGRDVRQERRQVDVRL